MKRINKEQLQIVIVATVLSGCGHGFLLNTLSMFVKPVSEALGFARGSFALYSTIATAVTVAALPLYGELYQRVNFKRLLIGCSAVCGCIFMGYSFSSSLWQFYLLAICFGLFFNGVNLTAAANLINSRFTENKGLATGIAFAGSGVFAAAMVSVLGHVTEAAGWRWAYRTAGLSSMCLILPTVWFFLPSGTLAKSRKPADTVSEKKNQTADDTKNSQIVTEVEMTRKQAFHTLTLYALLFGGFLAAFISQGIVSNMVAALSDAGYDAVFQGTMASLTMLTLGFSKILMGKVMDSWDGRAGIALFLGALLVSVGALLALENPVFPVVAAVSAGLGGSGCTVVLSCFTRDFFGAGDYSRIYAVVNASSYLGTALGVSVPGMVFDRFGSYQTAWHLFFILVLTAAAAYFTAYGSHLRRINKWEKKEVHI